MTNSWVTSNKSIKKLIPNHNYYNQNEKICFLANTHCRIADGPDSQAQSLKDLLNKENIEKAVNAITGKSTASMEGTWTYAGSAIEFESDNLLQKAGGAVAANAAENKLNEQLAR